MLKQVVLEVGKVHSVPTSLSIMATRIWVLETFLGLKLNLALKMGIALKNFLALSSSSWFIVGVM